jgi:hypothetical protein
MLNEVLKIKSMNDGSQSARDNILLSHWQQILERHWLFSFWYNVLQEIKSECHMTTTSQEINKFKGYEKHVCFGK